MPEPKKNAETEKKAKDRSPNFPSINLKEAIERVKLLYDADKMAGSSRESTYKHLGYSGANGASLGILAALKKFDLIKEENARIFVSENARTILLLPITDERRKKALKFCALSPKIYNEIWGKFSESGLPSDETLKTDLIFEKGFSNKSALKFISDFKQTLSFAGIEEGDYLIDNSEKEQAQLDIKNKSDKILNDEQIRNLNALRNKRIQHKPSMENAVVKEYEIPRKGKKLAVLQLELPISNEDYDNITGWLELFKDTLIDEEQEEKAELLPLPDEQN